MNGVNGGGNGNGEAANGVSGGSAIDFWRRKEKKALKREKKQSKRRAKAEAKRKAENGGLAELAAPMETITKGKLRVSPHKTIPVDAKGAYLVVPAESAPEPGSSGGESGSDKASAKGEGANTTAESSVSKWVGRLFGAVESVPLVVGAAGTVLGALGHSLLQARGASASGGKK